jgi:hypothetical protein
MCFENGSQNNLTSHPLLLQIGNYMKPTTLLEGLKANYPQSVHPTDVAQHDFIRTLKNTGYSEQQFDKLYDRLLSDCEFFPRIADIYRCAAKLNLERPGINEITRTRQLLDSQSDSYTGGITFNEWLYGGGYEEIIEDCGGDMKKVHKRLNLMGVTSLPERKRPKEPQKFEFLAEDLPMFEWPSSSIDEL